MVSREITIGRSKDCDIYVDPRCEYASSNHGTIYYDGYQLVFKDTSSNGTVINNVKIKHQAVPIRRGDVIMLAGKYQLGWQQIERFFPNLPQQQAQQGNRGAATVLERPVQVPQPDSAPAAQQKPAQEYAADGVLPLTGKWSWGAFALYPIWGFFNGCWWAFFVGMFLGWSCIPSIVFGIYGRRWSWQNRQWSSPASYNDTQKKWDMVGLILFILNIVLAVLSSVLAVAFWASIVGHIR